MSLMEILIKYLNALWGYFQFDVWVYSQWWTYAIILIPAMFYTIFFFFKWAILTAPIWVPFSFIFGSLKKLFTPQIIQGNNESNTEKRT